MMFSTDLISQIVVGEEKHADCRPCRMGLGKDTTTPKVKTKVIQNNITVPKMGISGPYLALFILRGLSPYRQGLHAAVFERGRLPLQKPQDARFRAHGTGIEGRRGQAAKTTGTKTRSGVNCGKYY